jgi:hypothetical protein
MYHLFYHQTGVEKEVRRRINVALWAYAYEIENQPIVTDAQFDEECKRIDLSIDTPRPHLDIWFRNNFVPYTGSWIYQHPNLKRLKELYNAYHQYRRRRFN